MRQRVGAQRDVVLARAAVEEQILEVGLDAEVVLPAARRDVDRRQPGDGYHGRADVGRVEGDVVEVVAVAVGHLRDVEVVGGGVRIEQLQRGERVVDLVRRGAEA